MGHRFEGMGECCRLGDSECNDLRPIANVLNLIAKFVFDWLCPVSVVTLFAGGSK